MLFFFGLQVFMPSGEILRAFFSPPNSDILLLLAALSGFGCRYSLSVHRNSPFRGQEAGNYGSVHRNGLFRGQEAENDGSVHRNALFRG